MQLRLRPRACRPRESPAQQSQSFEGTVRAVRRSSQGRARPLAPAEAKVPEPDAAQFPLPLQIRLRRRKARIACGRRIELQRRSARQQSGQKIASAEKEFGWLLI